VAAARTAAARAAGAAGAARAAAAVVGFRGHGEALFAFTLSLSAAGGNPAARAENDQPAGIDRGLVVGIELRVRGARNGDAIVDDGRPVDGLREACGYRARDRHGRGELADSP
jgi:hypothetical protein